jgi:excisionase family DNA binding protein
MNITPQASIPTLPDSERLAYSVEESAQLLGVHYFSVYRMIQRGKLRACRVLRGKQLVLRSELYGEVLLIVVMTRDATKGLTRSRSA